ncbi:MAG: branched-chain alpha-keto acid dehydrogenase subunit E2 [Desulfuromonas sp.]|nr:MAG: branched-chain alpha-keto acid dehydrogenase subunit E2 [Desulfuromonas sp.]
MALEVVVPEVSDGVAAGTVISVAVAVGDRVEEDQTLLEMETDKAVVAIPSPADGKITEIRVGEGESAAVGSVIMLLEVEGGAAQASPADEAPTPALQTEEPATATAVAEPPVAEAAVAEMAATLDLTAVRRNELVAPAAPSVRRIARDLGVDIYQVQGSGPGGRISADDVRQFVRETMQRVTSGGEASVPKAEFRGLHAQRTLPDFSRWGQVTRTPLSKVREVTADSMGYAWSTIPMVTQYDKAQVGPLEAFRRDYNVGAPREGKLTMTAILLKVCAAALKAFPQFNSSLDLAAKELVLKEYVHIGVAVDTPNGLLVPVVRDVAEKGIATLATELNVLAEKTRERKVMPDELDGGTFTISNLGGIGGTAFTPIVYAPQVAILGVSRTLTEPVWNGSEFVPQDMLPLSLTYDHRVIDGADGARFLRWICEALENPLKLVM